MRNIKLAFSAVVLAVLLVSCGESKKTVDDDPLSLAATEFVDLLLQENFEAAVSRFDSTMTKELPLEKLSGMWTEIVTEIGPFRKQLGTRIDKVEPHDIVFVTLRFLKFTLDVKVVFDEQQKIAGLFFLPSETPHDLDPPPYVDRETFTEQEMTIGADEWPLPASLSLPKGDGPFPVVVMVHGSGPQDRDETIGPNKPFRDIAWGLASQGIAVLRYVKRTREHGQRIIADIKNMTVRSETIEDALHAVAALRQTEKIDKQKIFVLGHSLGGMMIPRIGLEDKEIAGFIIMAGSSRPLEDVIIEQMRYLLSIQDSVGMNDQKALEKLEKQVARVKDADLTIDSETTDLPYGLPASYWLDLREYNPADAARELHRPIYILQGELDFQVAMSNFTIWKESLGSFDFVRFKSYPDLNHLFIKSNGDRSPREYFTPGFVSKEFVDDIANWVKEQ